MRDKYLRLSTVKCKHIISTKIRLYIPPLHQHAEKLNKMQTERQIDLTTTGTPLPNQPTNTRIPTSHQV